VQDKQKVMKTKYFMWLNHLSPYTVKLPFKLSLESSELNIKVKEFVTEIIDLGLLKLNVE
jgi:hypothetical protein